MVGDMKIQNNIKTDAVSNSKYGYNGRPQAYLLRETTKNWRYLILLLTKIRKCLMVVTV